MIAGRPPAIPAMITGILAFAIGGAVWQYFVAFHEMARGLVGTFGSPMTSVLLSAVGTLLGALPLLALVPLALLPRWWFGRGLPERRRADGRCPDCAYPCTRFPCPECGGDGTVAPLDLFTPRAIRGVLLVAALLMAGGILQAEWRVRRDESRFLADVEGMVARGERRPLARPRAGWASFALLKWDAAEGFAAPPPFEYPRIPGWRAAGRQAPDAGN